jgi:hypothetical protein
MTTASYDTTRPINSWMNDYNTPDGIRISTPTYIDLSQNQRKLLFSGVRTAIAAHREVTTPKTISGLTVETAGAVSSSIETFLDNLRSVIFSRGGVDLSLVLKLQAVTGIELVSVSELEKAYKDRIGLIKAYVKENSFNG